MGNVHMLSTGWGICDVCTHILSSTCLGGIVMILSCSNPCSSSEMESCGGSEVALTNSYNH